MNFVLIMPLTNKFVQFQSYSRNTKTYPDASSCVLDMQEYISNVQQIECVQMEFGNIRNTIEADTNNIFIYSEGLSVYRAALPQGVMSITDMTSALTYAMNNAYCMNTCGIPSNTYAVYADTQGQKVAIASDGISSYCIHTISTQISVTSITTSNSSDTYLELTLGTGEDGSGYGYGHLLILRIQNYGSCIVQVITSSTTSITVETSCITTPNSSSTTNQTTAQTIIAAASSTITTSYASITSYSNTDITLSEQLGFSTTNDPSTYGDDGKIRVIAIKNPFAVTSSSSTISFTISTITKYFAKSNAYAKLNNSNTLLDGKIFTITQAGSTVLTTSVDISTLWTTGSTSINDILSPSTITYNGITNGLVSLTMQFASGHTSVLIPSTITFTTSYFNSSSPIVCSIYYYIYNNTDNLTAHIQIPMYPSDGSTKLTSISSDAKLQIINNTDTTVLNLYASYGYDTTIHRRIIGIRLLINNIQQIGSLVFNSLQGRLFMAKLQLSHGVQNLQYGNVSTFHSTPHLTRVPGKISNIKFELYTEDGILYPLNGLNWSILIRFSVEEF
jgi:hypothetical protein